MTAGIRPYRDEDRDRLKEITAICFDGVSIDRNIEDRLGVVGGHDWRWRKLRQIDADISANPSGILVAEVDAAVVGYITTRVDSESRIGWIPNLSVHPAHQSRGLGRQLMEAALDWLRAAGMACVRIETLEQNQVGQHFYPAMGFEEVARQIHYVMQL